MDDDHSRKKIEPFEGPLPEPPEPVEVSIAGDEPVAVRDKPHRKWTPFVAAATSGENTRVAGANDRRRSLVIVNAGGATAFLVPSRHLDYTQGVPLDPGKSVTMEHQEAVWFIVPTATQAAPAVLNGWMEFEV